MSNVTVTRSGEIIVQHAGAEHKTGWLMLGRGVGGTPYLIRGTAKMVAHRTKSGAKTVVFQATAHGERIPVPALPLPRGEFQRLTGWAPECSKTIDQPGAGS